MKMTKRSDIATSLLLDLLLSLSLWFLSDAILLLQ